MGEKKSILNCIKKMLKCIIVVLLILYIIDTNQTESVLANEFVTGECGVDGDNVIWSYDDNTLTLKISGTGEMQDFSYYSAPWSSYSSLIRIVEIENGITNIGDYAFYKFSNLENIEIPSEVLKIGNYAFYGSALTEIIISDNVFSIGNNAFQYCTNLSSMTLGYNTSRIGNNAFENCGSLTSVEIPNTAITVEIGASAFQSCNELKSLIIKSGAIVIIERSAFSFCTNLTDINFEEGSIVSMGDEVFYHTGVIDITFPEGVTNIGNDTFGGCENLVSVILPDSVTEIKSNAFRMCRKLSSVELGQSVKIIRESAFADCTELVSITLPNSVTKVASNAFANCTKLSSITMPCQVSYTPEEGGTVTTVHVFGEDGTCIRENCGVSRVSFSGGSLTLGDRVAVHFYMSIHDISIIENPDAYIQFTIPNNNTSNTVSIQNAVKKEVFGETMYVFTCNVNMKEMADVIKAQIISGDISSEVFEYSVCNYAMNMINAGTYSDKSVDLVKAMLHFGAAAQRYFNYNEENMADAELTIQDIGVVTKESFLLHRTENVTLEGYGTFTGISLSLESRINLKVYFEVQEGIDDSKIVFTVNGQNVIAKKETIQGVTYYVITLNNIAASNLDKKYEFTAISSDSQQVSFLCSALSYGYNVLSNGNVYSEELQDLVKTMYLYNVAANTYVGE